MNSIKVGLVLLFIIFTFAYGADSPPGLNNTVWGSPSDSVRKVIQAAQWLQDPLENQFPKDLEVKVFRTNSVVAGYPAVVRYYFWKNQLFQTTVVFNFDKLKNYDFNYNVYRSVNEYYNAIRSATLPFVFDIYDLLTKKYGKKEPVFKGLDPRNMFVKLDSYVKQERWNLRYNPYDYYQRIIAAAYARWDFPKTRAIFSINISASDKRFDYELCLTSLDLEKLINKEKDLLRMRGL
jgi:hypothetical protein